VEDMLELGKEETLRQLRGQRSYTFVTDTISAMEWWTCFKPERKSEQEPKITKWMLFRPLGKPQGSGFHAHTSWLRRGGNTMDAEEGGPAGRGT